MRHLRSIRLAIIASLISTPICSIGAVASQKEPYTIESAGAKDWACSLPIISFMGYRFGTPIKMKLMNGPVRIQALELWDDKDALYNVGLISFRNETNQPVAAIKLTLSLFAEDAPETVLQSWETDSIIFKKPLVEWRSIIDETRPHRIRLEGSELKDNFELGTIRLIQKASKSQKAIGTLVIKAKVSQIIYGDGTVWGRN